MDMLPIAVSHIVGTMLSLLLPGLVWGTVIAGLFVVVKDRLEEDDLLKSLVENRQKQSFIPSRQNSCRVEFEFIHNEKE